MSHRLLAFAVALPSAIASGSALADDPCELQGNLRSINSDTPARLTFVNRTSTARAILWIGFDGLPVEYSYLEPGGRFVVDTYLTHPWLVTDGPGNCYGIYLPAPNERTVTLTATGRFGPE